MRIPFYLLMVVVLLFGCKAETPDLAKGLVSFLSAPVYAAPNVTFRVQVQYGGGGKVTTVAYQVLDGDEVIATGSALTGSNRDGMGLFFESESISVTIDPVAYAGKTLTIYLDPEHEVTADEYTTTAYIDAYKKATFVVN